MVRSFLSFLLVCSSVLAGGCGKTPTSPTPVPPTPTGPPIVACGQKYDLDGIYIEITRCPAPGSVINVGLPIPVVEMVVRQSIVDRGWFRVWASQSPIGSPESEMEPLRNGDTWPWSNLSTLSAGIPRGGSDTRSLPGNILSPGIPERQRPGVTYILVAFGDNMAPQWEWNGGCHSSPRAPCALRQVAFAVNWRVQ